MPLFLNPKPPKLLRGYWVTQEPLPLQSEARHGMQHHVLQGPYNGDCAAVKELKLSYYIGETLLFSIYIYPF